MSRLSLQITLILEAVAIMVLCIAGIIEDTSTWVFNGALVFGQIAIVLFAASPEKKRKLKAKHD